MAIPIENPLSYYLHVGEALHKENTEKRLQELVGSVTIDREANAKTVAQYNQHCDTAQSLQDAAHKKKKARNWGIFGIILTAFALILLFSSLGVMEAVKGMLIAACVVGAIVGICVLCKKANARIRALQKQCNEAQQLRDAAYQQALAQMQALNDAFRDRDSLRLVEKTMPCIAFDSYFTKERLTALQGYGLDGVIDSEESVLETLSGELYGQPFLYDKRRVHFVSEKTYHGSLTIHWETEEEDSNGRTITRRHSQTLRASVTKPYPVYYDNTWLYYGHDALPKLNFSHTPKFSDNKNERELERTLRKGSRQLRRLEAKELRNGGDFTQMENTEFEVLFGATDRSDELAFRQMYTMQAQRNTLDLLLSDATYGDDFYYIKRGKLHSLKSMHRQGKDLYERAYSYRSHDVCLAEDAFRQKNARFYKDVFFDFAPILAIPALESVVDSRPILEGEKTAYNYEEYANALSRALRPKDCETDCILKITAVERTDEATL